VTESGVYSANNQKFNFFFALPFTSFQHCKQQVLGTILLKSQNGSLPNLILIDNTTIFPKAARDGGTRGIYEWDTSVVEECITTLNSPAASALQTFSAIATVERITPPLPPPSQEQSLTGCAFNRETCVFQRS